MNEEIDTDPYCKTDGCRGRLNNMTQRNFGQCEVCIETKPRSPKWTYKNYLMEVEGYSENKADHVFNATHGIFESEIYRNYLIYVIDQTNRYRDQMR